MSGFVSSPPPAPLGEGAPGDEAVSGGSFYPAILLADARDSLRLGTVITDVRLRDALRAGMMSAVRELRVWKAAQIAAGAASLALVDAETIDDTSILVLAWRRAVFAFAAADLVETHHDISATGTGKDRIEEQLLSADDHRRNGLHAIRDMIDVTRTAVELI